MRRLGAKKKVRVQVHRGLETARGVEAEGNSRGRRRVKVCIHAERLHHVRVGRHEHLPQRYGLERFFRLLAQDGGGPQTDFLAQRRVVCGAGRIALGADHIVQGRR